MTQNLIEQLTPEQDALFPIYAEKWRQIALCTEPIDHHKAKEAMKAAYALVGKQEPKISVFESPYAALVHIEKQSQSFVNIKSQLSEILELYFADYLERQVCQKVGSELYYYLWLGFKLESLLPYWNFLIPVLKQLKLERENVSNALSIPVWEGCLFDFCISELNCDVEPQKWQIFQFLVKHYALIFAYEKICFICDRPRILSFDSQHRFHAEGQPAIQFADGFSVYAYHGVRLPKKYGQLHPNQWHSEWLLSESNAELRRVLIQGIGYSRICQELQAIELDTEQEYTLLKIDSNLDVEPIYLLKMTCPSTGYVHAIRVPLYIQSAREAITWVNWGIAPEEFSVQT